MEKLYIYNDSCEAYVKKHPISDKLTKGKRKRRFKLFCWTLCQMGGQKIYRHLTPPTE